MAKYTVKDLKKMVESVYLEFEKNQNGFLTEEEC